MTSTLLKHEWLRTRAPLGALFGIITLVVLLGCLLLPLGSILATFGLIVAVGAAILLVPAAQFLLTADFWRSGFGRTGYFTQSLPVKGGTVFRAKLGWNVIASLAALVWAVVLGLLIRQVAEWTLEAAPPGPRELWQQATGVMPVWMLVGAALLLLAYIGVWPIFYYFSVSIGHEKRLAGLGAGGPIVVFVGVYLVVQVVTFLGLLAIPFGIGMDGDRLGVVPFHLLDEMTAGTSSSDVMPFGVVVILVVAAVCLWRTARSWNHRIALR